MVGSNVEGDGGRMAAKLRAKSAEPITRLACIMNVQSESASLDDGVRVEEG